MYAAFADTDAWQHPARNLNSYINSMFVPIFIVEATVHLCGSLGLAHYVVSYVRNLLAGLVVYYGTAGVFHYFCYIHPSTSQVYAHRPRPTSAVIWSQIRMAQASLFVYMWFPVVDDWIVEHSTWTRAYYTIQDMGGWSHHCCAMAVYFGLVEIGVYWVHRTLHTNKWLYRHLHSWHHQYTTRESLTPWASIASHPIDGLLHAVPHVVAMCVVPCHYPSHIGLFFCTAIWSTYIHDAVRTLSWSDLGVPLFLSHYHTDGLECRPHHGEQVPHDTPYTLPLQLWTNFYVL